MHCAGDYKLDPPNEKKSVDKLVQSSRSEFGDQTSYKQPGSAEKGELFALRVA